MRSAPRTAMRSAPRMRTFTLAPAGTSWSERSGTTSEASSTSGGTAARATASIRAMRSRPRSVSCARVSSRRGGTSKRTLGPKPFSLRVDKRNARGRRRPVPSPGAAPSSISEKRAVASGVNPDSFATSPRRTTGPRISARLATRTEGAALALSTEGGKTTERRPTSPRLSTNLIGAAQARAASRRPPERPCC